MAVFSLTTALSDPRATLVAYLDGVSVMAGAGTYTSPPLTPGHQYIFQFYVEAPLDSGTDYKVEVSAPLQRTVKASLGRHGKDFGGFKFIV